MENEKHECWSSHSEGCDCFFQADNQSARQMLPSDAKLLFVIEAASWNEAQQKRYDLMNWGHYKTIEEERGAT